MIEHYAQRALRLADTARDPAPRPRGLARPTSEAEDELLAGYLGAA
jgi:hypothetical protein